VDQVSEPDRLVALRAERDGAVLSWDTHEEMAANLKEHLESEGWTVTISTNGPRRRRMPRVDRHRARWAP
jgi:hypothetical protein